jgi:TnpA family transposase
MFPAFFDLLVLRNRENTGLVGQILAKSYDIRKLTPVRTLNAGPNPKYFGYEHGVTYYNLISNQFTG